ncbi:hypothetical protein CA606_19765 [Caulobacter vibrioides]|uniref:Uncharacterized protein n=1 Tax=Caulobacter vibrioides TaxID=155892 RepID=A0A290MZF3_CAUVI|nr:hypothetical protein CA606_19765 [Caulobacter vibrioides]
MRRAGMLPATRSRDVCGLIRPLSRASWPPHAECRAFVSGLKRSVFDVTEILPPAGEVARRAGGGSPAAPTTSPSVAASRRHFPRWGED